MSQRIDLLSVVSVLWGSGTFLWRLMPGSAEYKPEATSPPGCDLGSRPRTGQDPHSVQSAQLEP